MQKHLLAISLLSISFISTASDFTYSGFVSVTAELELDEKDPETGIEDLQYDFTDRTRAGISFQYEPMKNVSLTSSLITEGKNDYSIDIDQAYASYTYQNFKFNGGRIPLPIFKYSEDGLNGYKHLWTSLPDSIYGFSLRSIDGVSTTHNYSDGDVGTRLTLLYGNKSGNSSLNDSVVKTEFENLVSVVGTINYKAISLRASYAQSDATIDIANTDFQNLQQSIINFTPSLLSNFKTERDKVTTFSIAGDLNYQNWIFEFEMTRTQIQESWIPKQDAAFVLAGRKMGDVTMHYSYIRENDQASFNPLIKEQLPPAFEEAIQRNDIAHNIGMRYDFQSNAAFKLDFFRSDSKNAYSIFAGLDVNF